MAAEYDTYDEMQAVDALMALTLYVVLRLSESNEDATNFDVPLLRTLMAMTSKNPLDQDRLRQWSQRSGTSAYLARMGPGRVYPKVSKAPFVILTGLRILIPSDRGGMLIFIIDRFFDVFTCLYETCDESWLRSMTLPATRNIFTANAPAEWEKEWYSRRTRSSSGLELTYADLADSKPENAEGLQSWMEAIDDFGMFVMSSASVRKLVAVSKSSGEVLLDEVDNAAPSDQLEDAIANPQHQLGLWCHRAGYDWRLETGVEVTAMLTQLPSKTIASSQSQRCSATRRSRCVASISDHDETAFVQGRRLHLDSFAGVEVVGFHHFADQLVALQPEPANSLATNFLSTASPCLAAARKSLVGSSAFQGYMR
ncbi:hypothetical protein MRB53_037211 [Persea americana]|nr:hypothetical protein MRB53_037211 [Persea americana]